MGYSKDIYVYVDIGRDENEKLVEHRDHSKQIDLGKPRIAGQDTSAFLL